MGVILIIIHDCMPRYLHSPFFHIEDSSKVMGNSHSSMGNVSKTNRICYDPVK
jgi:hypothetical protein